MKQPTTLLVVVVVALLASLALGGASAQAAVAKVRETANSNVKGVRADIAACSDLDRVETLLPTCDLTDPKTRESIECRTLLKGAGSKELGTAVEVGRVRGAKFLLPASEPAGKLVRMGGAGYSSLFGATVTPEDDAKPVGLTLRAFHGAAPIGERIKMNVKDFAFLGTPDNMASNAVGVLREQCDEAKVQPGTRVVCGACLLKGENLKELAITADPSNKEVVSLPLKDGDTELGAIVSGAARAGSSTTLAAAAAGAAALAVLAF